MSWFRRRLDPSSFATPGRPENAPRAALATLAAISEPANRFANSNGSSAGGAGAVTGCRKRSPPARAADYFFMELLPGPTAPWPVASELGVAFGSFMPLFMPVVPLVIEPLSIDPFFMESLFMPGLVMVSPCVLGPVDCANAEPHISVSAAAATRIFFISNLLG